MYSKINLERLNFDTEPPSEEPARQYYFMKKCREIVKKRSQELGRPLFACVTTFGCQMNARDSEKLLGILKEIGYEETVEEDADLVLYNTCTVRDNANQRVYGRLGVLNSKKKQNPHMIVALCGCMMQEEAVIEKIRKSYAFVDLIFGTHNIFKLAELLWAVFESDRTVVDIWREAGAQVEALPVRRKYPFKSGVNIMYGCDNFCSYCIVPYVRGRERSRRPSEILEEIGRLADDGVVEVMLLGQNVNSYGKNLEQPVSFTELLRQVEKIRGVERIRFMTSHPKDLSDDLIRTIRGSEKICRHLHLPLQSGSSAVLKRMNRRYTKEQYLALADKIRREIPDIAITTDIIVGFPGETAKDVDETMDVVKRVGFEGAFTFLYSKRTGTPAASMEEQVPREAAQQGFDRLLRTVQETAAARAQRFVGRTMPVLVEEVSGQDPSMMTGRLSTNAVVHFPGDVGLTGKMVDVGLTECRGFYYFGEIR